MGFRGGSCGAVDFLQLIGWTPLIELKRIAGKEGVGARIVGKIEAYQPLCSVKDRSALRYCYLILIRFISFNKYWDEISLDFGELILLVPVEQMGWMILLN